MNKQEAINILKSAIKKPNTEDGYLGQSIHMAISALEKQIPKKPYIQQDEKDNDCLECPNCDSFVGYVVDCKDEHYQDNYCVHCGQKLDWSE